MKKISPLHVSDATIYAPHLVSKRFMVVEQPCSSLLNSSHAFETGMMICNGRTFSFDHAAYEDEEPEYVEALANGDSMPAEKSLKVMGTTPWLHSLERRCRKDVQRERLTEKHGSKGHYRVTGKPDVLKSSEHYCQKFGDFVGELHLEYLKTVGDLAQLEI